MRIDHPHSFNQEEAITRLQALTDYWNKKYGVNTSWQGNTASIKGKVKGISFDGTFMVGEKSLRGEVNVGFLAERLGGKAYVENKLSDYLNPQNTLEGLQARAR